MREREREREKGHILLNKLKVILHIVLHFVYATLDNYKLDLDPYLLDINKT